MPMKPINAWTEGDRIKKFATGEEYSALILHTKSLASSVPITITMGHTDHDLTNKLRWEALRQLFAKLIMASPEDAPRHMLQIQQIFEGDDDVGLVVDDAEVGDAQG